MEKIYNQNSFQNLPFPAQCSKCNTILVSEYCKCEGGPSIFYWTVKPEEEDFWFMDGSVKPMEIKISELKKYQHETV